MTLLWRSEREPSPLPPPVASGVRGGADYLCPVCSAVVFAGMSDGQVKAGDKAFCRGCDSALEVPQV